MVSLEAALRRPLAWHSLRLHALVLVVVIVGILAGGILVARHVTASIDQLVAATTGARLQAGAAQEVLDVLQDAETGQRGYMLTRREYYLEPYSHAVSRADGALARLARLATGTPWMEAEAERLIESARLKLAEMADTIALARSRGVDAALAVILTDAGKTYMDDARASVGRIVQRAEAERAQRAMQLQSRQSLVTVSILAALGVGVLLLGLAGLVLLWNHAQLHNAREGEQREAARLQAAVEHVPDGVGVFDHEERLLLCNSRFAPVLGLAGDLVQPGVLLIRLLNELDLDPPALSGPRPRGGPEVAEARLGARTLQVWRSPMPAGGQMVAVSDISRRVAAEEVARQAQKMEVLGQMTGGVAHDFNNLLQVVSANLELVTSRLARRGGAEAWLTAGLEAASAGVARGARLTRHLLAFARRQPLAPEPLDPARLVLGMEDMLRRTVGEAVELRLAVGGGLWAMRADPNQVENALLNLALNARDAMAGPDSTAAGRLTVEVANATLDQSYAARTPEVAAGQYVMLAVTDSGVGMGPEQLARATEPFYTTKQDGKGTGLGLSMVFGFAKQSGGHFQLYSEPGRGTTARLYIPRTLAAAAVPEAATSSVQPSAGELVLLVEDDEAVRSVAADALRMLGYRVEEAGDADAGLALLQGGLRPALLFTDVVMPGQVSSRELAAEARLLLPDLAVLFTSGYTQDAIVHNGQLDPGISLISKPWRTDDLARAVRGVLDAARSPRPAARKRVLLVEDEEMVRMTTADALADLGYDVVEAETGAEAMSSLLPRPDLLMTDLGLPDGNGMDLIARIHLVLPGLPVVIASGQGASPDGAAVWLAKPYDLRGLRLAVERALAG